MNHGELLAVPPATDLASHWWREHGRFGKAGVRGHIVSGIFCLRSTINFMVVSNIGRDFSG